MAKERENKEIVDEEEKINEINCGYIAPISEIAGLNSGYWIKLKNIIQEVIEELNTELKKDNKKLIFRMVSDNETSDIIQESIVKSLYYDKVVICNISYRNPNVLFELGMRIAFNKSVIMIFDNIEKCPFDVAGIRYITYDKNLDYYDIIEFKKNLKIKIKEVLDSKEEGNPYLRILKDEVFFEVTPRKKEITESDKILLDKLGKIESELINIKNNSLKKEKEINNDFFISRVFPSEIPDINFYKSLNENEAIQKILKSDPPLFYFQDKAIRILRRQTNLFNIFSEKELLDKLEGYYKYYYSYIKD
ncbi:nucleotide-binding protein [Fusobacterium nucleatum]|uniref:hypothetical protein n=1 Tax=Fusobacterium nucleatum TaxID=851 RepID=UPI0030D1B368